MPRHLTHGPRDHGGPVPLDYDPDDLCLLVAETVPDGMLTRNGSGFEKTWTLRNAGSARWIGRWLTRQDAPEAPGRLRSPRRVRVPDTEPGGLARVTVTLRTPARPGAGIARFQITDAAGRPYFPGKDACALHCVVNVVD